MTGLNPDRQQARIEALQQSISPRLWRLRCASKNARDRFIDDELALASKNITVEMFHWLKQSQPFLAG
jgi:hypothetical protein